MQILVCFLISHFIFDGIEIDFAIEIVIQTSRFLNRNFINALKPTRFSQLLIHTLNELKFKTLVRNLASKSKTSSENLQLLEIVANLHKSCTDLLQLRTHRSIFRYKLK